MKKLAIIPVMAISLFIILSIPFSADARGRHTGAGLGGYHSSTTIVEQEVIFEVTPSVFRKAMAMFQKEYPEHSCGGWQYDYNSQTYDASCSKKDATKNYGTLYLTMDGYIKFQMWGDETPQITVILGDWGVFY